MTQQTDIAELAGWLACAGLQIAGPEQQLAIRLCAWDTLFLPELLDDGFQLGRLTNRAAFVAALATRHAA